MRTFLFGRYILYYRLNAGDPIKKKRFRHLRYLHAFALLCHSTTMAEV